MQRVSGAFRLFRLAGIDVYLHWSWLLIAFYELRFRDGDPGRYISPVWNVVEYLSLCQVGQVGFLPGFLDASEGQLHAADVRQDLEVVLAEAVAE